jgi:DNA polymerase-3 subunit epsilon
MEKHKVEFPELLWPFLQVPDDYIVLDLETTGLFDEGGAPSILTIGVVDVSRGQAVSEIEYRARPSRPITEGARAVHGISEAEASEFPEINNCWDDLLSILHGRLVVIHNAAFDWMVINETARKHKFRVPHVEGVFCSQKSSYPWALAVGLEVSARGPSLDSLTRKFEIHDMRADIEGLHGALVDAKQTASLVEVLKECAKG